MRLLHCSSDSSLDAENLVLEEFTDDNIPSYAILSHTWGTEEVTFADVQHGTAAARLGYNKIWNALQITRNNYLQYLWVDTCCIDKSSSSELSEAINSMYKWYQRARCCFVYLEDLAPTQTSFAHCRWLTRGWCLQELLAPRHLIFFDTSWTVFGTKVDMCEDIAKATGIHLEVLTFTKRLQSMSIAQRMSWASKRETTRREDMAYCLMGIFSVNMPLLYGEGERAFSRLQEEIIKTSDDHSIFAWTIPCSTMYMHGLLADSPAAFAGAHQFVRYHSSANTEPFQMTNRGLKISLSLTPHESTHADEVQDTFLAALDCPIPGRAFSGQLAIALQRISGDQGHEYKRVRCGDLYHSTQPGQYQSLYVRQQPLEPPEDSVCAVHYLILLHAYSLHQYEVADVKALRVGTVRSAAIRASDGEHIHSWLPPRFRGVFGFHREAGRLSAAILFRSNGSYCPVVLLLGAISDLELGYDVIIWRPNSVRLDSLAELQERFKPLKLGETRHLSNSDLSFCVSSRCRIFGNEKREEVVVSLSHAGSEY